MLHPLAAGRPLLYINATFTFFFVMMVIESIKTLANVKNLLQVQGQRTLQVAHRRRLFESLAK